VNSKKQQQPLQKLYSKEEAARVLGGVSTKTVDRLIKDGKIEVKRLQRRVMPTVESVHALADSK
jgi:hypothetical protein